MASLSTGLPFMCHYPCMLESMYHWAFRFAGLPRCIQHGLRLGPASMYLTVYLAVGLPLCRAALTRLVRPPADIAFHVYVDLGSGSPAWKGFPILYCTASGIARPLCILPCILAPGLLLCRALYI